MTTYWLSDFCSLFNSLNINPFVGTDKNFQFNSLTRLIIFMTFLCAILFQDSSNQIFLGGAISIFLSVVIYMLTYNSSEMSTRFTGELKSYIDSQKIIEDQDENLKIGLSKMGEVVLEDQEINVENEVTLDYVPRNTKNIKAAMFLERNKMPSHVTNEPRNPNDYISLGKQVTSGTAKQLHSLIGKNLSGPI